MKRQRLVSETRIGSTTIRTWELDNSTKAKIMNTVDTLQEYRAIRIAEALLITYVTWKFSGVLGEWLLDTTAGLAPVPRPNELLEVTKIISL